MFDLPSTLDTNPDYAKAGNEASGTLLGFIVDCQNAGLLAQGDPEPLALIAWSMVHGIAKLAFPNNPARALRFRRQPYHSSLMVSGIPARPA
jgi:hypothetical protein